MGKWVGLPETATHYFFEENGLMILVETNTSI
jgi:hypothetical protein